MNESAVSSGTLERVLALKAIPELTALHPDDVAGLARAASPLRFDTADTPQALVDSVLFLVEGTLRRPAAIGGEDLRAPRVVGLVEMLTDSACCDFATETGASGLVVEGAILRELLAAEFELWRAAARHICALLVGARAEMTTSIGNGIPAHGSDLDELAERIELLRGVTPFRNAGIHMLGQIASQMRPRLLADRELVWEAGHPVSGALLLVEGAVAVGDATGRRADPGSLIGLTEALGAPSYPHRVASVGPSRALWIDLEGLLDVLEDDSEAAIGLLCALGHEVARSPEGASDGRS